MGCENYGYYISWINTEPYQLNQDVSKIAQLLLRDYIYTQDQFPELVQLNYRDGTANIRSIFFVYFTLEIVCVTFETASTHEPSFQFLIQTIIEVVIFVICDHVASNRSLF